MNTSVLFKALLSSLLLIGANAWSSSELSIEKGRDERQAKNGTFRDLQEGRGDRRTSRMEEGLRLKDREKSKQEPLDEASGRRNKAVDQRSLKAGPISTGGGNGVQLADGKIVPLDLHFAQENKSVDVKTSYPVAYKAFQNQIEKIKKAIPSFARDIEDNFAKLQWTLTNLEMDNRNCRNNTGVFKMRSGEKQLIGACQEDDGEVILSRKMVKAFQAQKNEDYLGVIFLHEAFVYKMLAQYSREEYPEAEYKMITKVTPYILSNQVLDPAQLYSFTNIVGYLPSDFYNDNKYNKYALEAFPNVRAEFEKQNAEIAAIEKLVTKGLALAEQFHNDQLPTEERYTRYFNALDSIEKAQDMYEDRATSAKLTDAERAQAAAEYIRVRDLAQGVRNQWSAIANRLVKAGKSAQ